MVSHVQRPTVALCRTCQISALLLPVAIMKASLIDMTDDLVELLFHYAITIGVHLAGRKDVSKK